MKKKTLLQEMNEALLSHGPAHYVAVKWFEKRERRKHAKKTANDKVSHTAGRNTENV